LNRFFDATICEASETTPFFPHVSIDELTNQRVFTMRVEPIGDKIVVKREEAEDKTAGGIILPDAAQQKPLQGRVLSIGDGIQLPNGARAKPQVREGDRVYFTQYSGNEVIVDNEELIILSESDILAVLE